jgi:hypothetical protein
MYLLTNPNISFILINPEVKGSSQLENNWNCERLCSVLYSKDFTVFTVKELYQNQYTNCFLGISSENSNDEIRNEALQVLEFLNIDQAIIKYVGVSNPTLILKNGVEKPLEFSVNEGDENSKTYIHDGVSFCFKEAKRFHYPTKKDQLKEGIIVEYYNNNKWNKKQIVKLDEEFDKMYNLLIKYNKLRIPM